MRPQTLKIAALVKRATAQAQPLETSVPKLFGKEMLAKLKEVMGYGKEIGQDIVMGPPELRGDTGFSSPKQVGPITRSKRRI